MKNRAVRFKCNARRDFVFASALTFYLSSRYSEKTRLCFRLEQIADVIFVAAFVIVTLLAPLFAYEVIQPGD